MNRVGSLRMRMTLLCVVSFVGGGVLVWFTKRLLRDLWLSIFDRGRICVIPFLYGDGGLGELESEYECPSFPVPVRLIGVAGVVLGLGLVVLVLYRIMPRLLSPIAAMANTVRQLGPQNLGQRIRYGYRRDEIRALADALDEMLDRVATGYEGQRRFAANASHELRTPITVQRTLVEVAMVTGEQDLSRLAAQLLAVNERNERLIEGLLVLAESDRGLPGVAPVRLDTLVAEVLDRFAEQADKHEVVINRGMVERTVSGDHILLERLVSNLVHNAIKYNEPGGTIDVVVGGEPALSIQNTGQRVPAEVVPALFEPFRRLTAERTHQRDGAGLGLSIVRSIVTAHQGTIDASPGGHGGLRVTVSLP